MKVSLERLSRLVSHALRHEPWVYEIELDEQGWVSIDALLAAIQEQGPPWLLVSRSDLVDMIASSDKQRHEIDGERIRALYGHSVPGRLARVAGQPPPVLFHGTSHRAWVAIQRGGLLPMGRQYVHLSVDVATAELVGRRKSSEPVVVSIDTIAAVDAGTTFWRGNDLVWLADFVEAGNLSIHRRVGAIDDGNECYSDETLPGDRP
jgi:putative RNA 2'-phosphotransferase